MFKSSGKLRSLKNNKFNKCWSIQPNLITLTGMTRSSGIVWCMARGTSRINDPKVIYMLFFRSWVANSLFSAPPW